MSNDSAVGSGPEAMEHHEYLDHISQLPEDELRNIFGTNVWENRRVLPRLDAMHRDTRQTVLHIGEELGGKVAGLEGKVAGLEGKVAELGGKVAELGGRVEELGGRVEELGGRVEELWGNMAGKMQDIEALLKALLERTNEHQKQRASEN